MVGFSLCINTLCVPGTQFNPNYIKILQIKIKSLIQTENISLIHESYLAVLQKPSTSTRILNLN